MGKSHINLNDFSAIYEENQDASLEFKSISGDYADSTSLKYSMINAIRTFDHQGTGFISINEFKFSNNLIHTYRYIYNISCFCFVVLTGLGDKLKDTEFDDLRQFMEVSPNGQVSYDRKKDIIFIINLIY